MARGIRGWLEGLELGRYADAFAAHEIEIVDLPELSENDLKELGLPLGPRRRILRAIAALAEPSDVRPSAPSSTPISPERRQLTVLFCDLVGSTALSGRLDPEDMRELLRRYQDAVAGVVSRHNGYVANYLGDGVLAYFGWPRAHEDQAAQAVRAGLAAIRAVAGLASPDGAALAARVGIASGQVVVGDLEGETARQTGAISGETPNLAARLQALASSGEVVIGGQTRALLGEQFALESLGDRSLRGIAEPVPVWRVRSEATAVSRFAARGGKLVRFVGRRHELGLLRERWRLAAGGEGQVVLLSGEAGIGKSRLLQELERDVGADGIRLRYQCAPHYANSAFYPVIRQLERAAGFEPEDDGEARLAKLAALVGGWGEPASLLGALLSLPLEARPGVPELAPEARKQRTIQALIDQLLALSATRPVLFLFEDAHWIDPSTDELLRETVMRLRDAPVLMLVTHRPEWRAPWTDQAIVTTLNMARLGREQATEIVTAIAGRRVDDQAMARIVARTDGVPLFVEELTKALVERGLDAADTDIPATLQASLSARLDRLGPEAREIAQIGAVIGREFDHELLVAAAGKPEPTLSAGLERLIESGLVFRSGLPPRARYTFKHALVQDAAYGSLLRSRRRSLHATIAGELLTAADGPTPPKPELVAAHLIEAGEAASAIGYLVDAGNDALRKSANAEAIGHLEKALSLLDAKSDATEKMRLELALRTTMGPAMQALKGFGTDEIVANYARAHELSELVGGDSESFLVSWTLARIYNAQCEYDRARAIGERLVARAEDGGDRSLRLAARTVLGTTFYLAGHLAEAHESLRAARDLYDKTKDSSLTTRYGADLGMMCMARDAFVLWHFGFADQGQVALQDMMSVAMASRHAMTEMNAVQYCAQFHLYRREYEVALRFAQQLIESCDRYGNVLHRQIGVYIAAVAQAMAAPHRTHVEAAAEAVHVWRGGGTLTYLPEILSGLGIVHARLNEMEAALSVVDEAIEIASSSGQRALLPELLRRRGEFLLASSEKQGVAAEASWLRAHDLAKQLGSRALALRIATDLASYWRDVGRRSQAREVLAQAVSDVSEGFDTPDFVEARALLDALD